MDGAELMIRARNLLKVKKFEDLLKRHNEILDYEVKQRTSELRFTLEDLSKANKQLEMSKSKIKEGYIDSILRLTNIAEYKDEDTASHIKNGSVIIASYGK